MKKKILLFVLAFAMIFTSLVSVAHAEEEGGTTPTGPVCGCPIHNADYVAPSNSCEGVARSVNIADRIEFSVNGDKDYLWHYAYHLDKLVDGDWHNGFYGSPKVTTMNYTMDFNGDEVPNYIEKLVFVLNSYGVCSNDSVIANMTTNDFSLRVDVYTWDEATQTEIKQDRQTFSGFSGQQTVTVDVNARVSKVYVEWYKQAYGTTWGCMWEVEAWSTEVSHIWELVNTDTAATCTVDGVGDYACACGARNDDQPIPATGHTAGTEWFIEPAVDAVEDDPTTEDVDETAAAIPEKHYNKCVNGDCTEKLNMAAHDYSSDCDITCNSCATARTSGTAHTYDFDCQTKCKKCDFVRTDAQPHAVDHACDAECNTCFEEIAIEHVYDDCEDTICNSVNADDPTLACGYERVAPGHAWDNACDNECNACGAANPDYAAGHFYDNCDDTVCNECEFTRTAVAHIYDNCDDTGCNTCGMTRTAVAHVYDNACDATCNNCTVTRTPADHVYDNACDATCNVCSAARTPAAHAYDNDCDKTCNVCNAERTVADHVYGEEFEESEAGTKVYTCSICGYKNDSGEKTGLGGGAIAGIVIGSVAVVGGGGFAAWWFIFKKKVI